MVGLFNLDFSNTDDRREASVTGRSESWWLILPYVLVRLAGIAVCLALVLASVKLDIYTTLPWWLVLLPITVTLGIVFLVLTIAVILWVRVAILFFSGNIEVEEEAEMRLDVLVRTAKICFLGHGYVVLLMVSLGLLLLKLDFWHSLQIVYPLLPLIVLGVAYIFLGLVFKQPEVDSPWFLLVGMSVLSQSIMLVIKLDHMKESEGLPWAVTFTPSWVTHMLLLIYCVVSPLRTFHEAQANDDSRSASSVETPYGGTEGLPSVSSTGKLHRQLLKVVGMACWVLGWALSQALLTLRLDVLYKVSWLSVILPVLLGWILLLVFCSGLVSEYFREVTETVLATLSLVPLGDCLKGRSDEKDPLIIYHNRP